MTEEKKDTRNHLRIPSIVAAISELDPGKHFTLAAKPECSALEELLGFEVTAGERDMAHEAFKKEQKKKIRPKGSAVVTGHDFLSRMKDKGMGESSGDE